MDDAHALGLAVEALFSTKEATSRAAALRRLRVQPLRTRVERLRRTVEKVRAEANRTEAAEEHRRFGELLRQNASAVPRGALEVTLTEYSTLGERAVRVPLDPALAARAHQRLGQLEGELTEAEAALAAARGATDASLLSSPKGPAAARPLRSAPRVHRPYRIFHARSGESILVG